MKTYTALARAVGARLRCLDTGNNEWAVRHEQTVLDLMENFPSGSGFDNGTKLDFEQSTGDKLVFHTAYHHMDEGGGYDGWTHHTITLTPALELGYRLHVGGHDRNRIKDYISDCFHDALNEDVSETIPVNS